LGWEVTVVTPHPSIWRHVDGVSEAALKTEREGIRRILTGHRWRSLMPDRLQCWHHGLGWVAGGIIRTVARRLGIDPGIGWIAEAERACAHLTPDDVDVVLASGPPFAVFSLARRVAGRLGRPYVLDYRDPWTGSPHAARPSRAATIRAEAQLLAGAAAVTIVSRSWALALDQQFRVGSKLHVVTNGYDPEELRGVEPHSFGHFAIVYAGTFYPPKRVISPVMAALRLLRTASDDHRREWYFHYYGPQQNHVREEANRYGVMDRVVLHGRVPRVEVLSATRGAGAAVVITSVFENRMLDDDGIVPGKVFETVGLGAPIVLVAPSGSDAREVVEASGVAKGFTGSDTSGMASFLAHLMSTRDSNPTNASAYSWETIARTLDAVLRGVRRTQP
jgi:glycosyltransferase involved in cell wall biosynthesis